MTCSACGLELSNGVKFCPECGAKAEPSAGMSKPPSRRQSGGSGKTLLIGISSAILAIAILLFVGRLVFSPSAQALHKEGQKYYRGEGVTQDYTKAVKMFRLAADQGYPDAQNNLGLCYARGEGVTQDYSEAVKWYRLAADQGYPKAQNNLGFCYDRGLCVAQDYSEAIKWFRLAADQGYPDAQDNLGLYYKNGLGVAQDYSEAVKWYRLAADQGLASAQYLLGRCYEDGRGVAKDMSEAVKWMGLAAENGDKDAKIWIESRKLSDELLKNFLTSPETYYRMYDFVKDAMTI